MTLAPFFLFLFFLLTHLFPGVCIKSTGCTIIMGRAWVTAERSIEKKKKKKQSLISQDVELICEFLTV